MKKRHLFEIVLIFVMTIVAYGYFYSGSDWNTNSRLDLVKAVVEEQRFEIDSYHVSAGLLTKDKALVAGHFYSDKAIGSSLIGVAFYLPVRFIYHLIDKPVDVQIFKELLTLLAVSLIVAFLAPFLYSFIKKVSNDSRWALLVTCAICLGTPLYKYSTMYYGHALAGLFLFVVFFIWFSIKGEEKINLLKILISGYFLGYSIVTEYPTALIALMLGFYIIYVLWKKQRLFDWKIYACIIIGAVVPVSVALMYNDVVFGHPLKTGYSYEVVKQFAQGQSLGLLGIGLPNLRTLFYMTFHTTMGVFWQSPILLLGPLGWFRMWKDSRYRAEAVLSFGIISIYFLMMSGYYIWWGGATFTPRNLIPAFPFFGIPLAFLVKKTEKISVLVLSIISMVQMFVVVVASPQDLSAFVSNRIMLATSIRLMFQQPSIIYQVYFPNFLHQIFELNRGQEFFQLQGFQSLIPFLLVEAIILAAFIRITSVRQELQPTVSHPR
jgi:hypothetical protein